MSLYKQWDDLAYQIETQEEYDKFWGEYLPKETRFYEYLLGNREIVLEKDLTGLAEHFEVDVLTTVGFLDGINTSLKNEIDIENLDEGTTVRLDIDFEKLFYNMLEAKAEWLYTLPQWDAILTIDQRKEIRKEYNKSKTFVNENKIGRNEDCPCGSGKKYKKCCGKNN